MGLDQYAYSATRTGQREDYYETVYGQDPTKAGTVTKPKDLAYWRKHPNLQGWMERLWVERGCPGADPQDRMFNGLELELTWEDLDRLEQDIKSGVMSNLDTVGFFFGEASDDYYLEQDLAFIRAARTELFFGLKVFYNSSW